MMTNAVNLTKEDVIQAVGKAYEIVKLRFEQFQPQIYHAGNITNSTLSLVV